MPCDAAELRSYCAKKKGLKLTFIVKPSAGCQGKVRMLLLPLPPLCCCSCCSG